jgi:amino acid transporter
MSSAVGGRPPGGQHREPGPAPAKEQPQAGALGLTSATGLVIGTVIGAGVFTMPAVLASAGTVSLLVLAVIAVGAMVLAILFGQLTRRVPNSDGGLYAYARYEFGDFAGYLTAWCYWVQAWAGNAAIVSSWVFYCDALFGINPPGSSPWWAGSSSARLTSARSTPRAAACTRRSGSPPGWRCSRSSAWRRRRSPAVMGLVAHHALVNNGAPFVNAFQTIFPHGTWAGKLVAALAAVSA